MRIGSRAQVMHGNAKQTSGGLKKHNLMYNKNGKIVSKRASSCAKRNMNLVKAGYVTRKGVFGSFKVGGGIVHAGSPTLIEGVGNGFEITGLNMCLGVVVKKIDIIDGHKYVSAFIAGHFVTPNMYSANQLTDEGIAFVDAINNIIEDKGWHHDQLEINVYYEPEGYKLAEQKEIVDNAYQALSAALPVQTSFIPTEYGVGVVTDSIGMPPTVLAKSNKCRYCHSTEHKSLFCPNKAKFRTRGNAVGSANL